MKEKDTRQLKILCGIGWSVFVLTYFFKCFPFIHLAEVLLNGLVLLILLLGFTAIGRRIFRYFQIAFSSFSEECLFSFGFGSGVVIFLVIGLAALQLLYEILIVGLMLFLFVLVYKDARYIVVTSYEKFSTCSLREKSVDDLVFILFIILAGVITFLAAATPPFFYDALVYHLAVPQQYLFYHGFQNLPHHHFSNFPANIGMLFIVALSFSKGGMLAKLLSWSFTPLTVMAVYTFTKTRWGNRMALTAATILFLVPGVLILSTITSVDAAVMFYMFLSFAALLSWFSSRQRSWFILTGVFCSLAVGTKYTAIVLAFSVVALLLVVHEYFIAKRSLVATLTCGVLLALIVLGGMAPWFIKNSIYTGNPIYPLLNSLIGTHAPQYTNYDQEVFTKSPPFVLVRSLLGLETFSARYWLNLLFDYLKAPWTVTMQTKGAAGKTGVLFLLCLPGVFFLKKKDKTVRYLLAIAGCAFYLWLIFFPGHVLRFVFLIFPPLSVTTAYILWNIFCSDRKRSYLFKGVMVVLCYHFFLFVAEEMYVLQPFSFLFANQAQAEFLLSRGVNHYAAMQYINQATPYNAKILFVGEIRGYYCEREYLIATNEPYDDQAKLLRQFIVDSQQVEEVLQKLHNAGITHILVNLPEKQRFAGERSSYFGFQTEKDRRILQALFSPQYLRLLFSRYEVNIYQILYPT